MLRLDPLVQLFATCPAGFSARWGIGHITPRTRNERGVDIVFSNKAIKPHSLNGWLAELQLADGILFTFGAGGAFTAKMIEMEVSTWKDDWTGRDFCRALFARL